MAALVSHETLGEKTIEHKWVIRNWKDVAKNEELIRNTNTEINLKEGNVIYAKFLVGTSSDGTFVYLYWKFLCKHHCWDNAQINLSTQIIKRDVTGMNLRKVQANVETEKGMEIDSFWRSQYHDSMYEECTDCEGSLILNLTFTLKNLPDVVCASQPEEFSISSKSELCQNLGNILYDEARSDVKIITRDKIELLAHKIILQARCPIFASMFGSGFLESNNGLVNVDDISSKTMKILLHYWYTGELQPAWKDDDTVVEFAYAAGKYQMTSVLKMLDGFLGIDINSFDGDIELLKMVHQLSLKKAEFRILKRITKRINQAKRGSEILNIFYGSLELTELDDGSLDAIQIVKIFNDALNENGPEGATFHDIKLLRLACKHGMEHVENKLLKRIKEAVVSVGSADELFAIFEDQKKETDSDLSCDDSDRKDLLVRANP